jgi:hypothetical protein
VQGRALPNRHPLFRVKVEKNKTKPKLPQENKRNPLVYRFCGFISDEWGPIMPADDRVL